MYHMVESVHVNREATLKLFLFSLKAIGSSKRGPQCAVEVMKRLGSSSNLGNFDLCGQSRKFNFFFSLPMIERDDFHYKRGMKLSHILEEF